MLGELSAAQIDEVLRGEVIGRLGCCTGTTVYVVPITYAYDGEYVYAHSADGMKIRLMRENPHVCFEVDHIDNLANWQSVIGWGTFEELHGADAERAMQRLRARLLSRAVSETSLPGQIPAVAQTYQAKAGNPPAVVYRIRLSERTGRFEREFGVSSDAQQNWDRMWGLI